jgi:hypothetical protein
MPPWSSGCRFVYECMTVAAAILEIAFLKQKILLRRQLF